MPFDMTVQTILGEARMRDTDIAEALGFERPRKIRELIVRHMTALESFGEVFARSIPVGENASGPTNSVFDFVAQRLGPDFFEDEAEAPHGGATPPPHRGATPPRHGGAAPPSKGTEYWLNKKQALFLCTKSDAAAAVEITIAMIRVFDAWEQGTLPPHPDPKPQPAFAHPDAPIDLMARQDVSNWLSLVREARLLRGPGAAVRMWGKSPLPSLDDPQPVDTYDKSDTLPQFIAACCTVTGRPADSVTSADLWRAFQHWQAREGMAPWSAGTFAKRFGALADRWRCPLSGQRFSRAKSSVMIYRGLVLEVGA